MKFLTGAPAKVQVPVEKVFWVKRGRSGSIGVLRRLLKLLDILLARKSFLSLLLMLSAAFFFFFLFLIQIRTEDPYSEVNALHKVTSSIPDAYIPYTPTTIQHKKIK